jgi:hypothetical protein
VKVPKRYLSKNPNVMKREIKKHAEKKDYDSSAYGPWDADYKSKKAGKGKPVKTNVSKYTKKYKEMYGESESQSKLKSIMDYESFSNSLNEGSRKGSVDTKGSPADKALRKKAEKSGNTLSQTIDEQGNLVGVNNSNTQEFALKERENISTADICMELFEGENIVVGKTDNGQSLLVSGPFAKKN